MKNSFVFLMNILFILAVSADFISVKYQCDTKLPMVTKSSYQQLQANLNKDIKNIDMMKISAIKL